MTDERFNEILEDIKLCGQHVTLGCHITETQFCILAHEASKFINRYGWDGYVKHMNLWRMRVDKNKD